MVYSIEVKHRSQDTIKSQTIFQQKKDIQFIQD